MNYVWDKPTLVIGDVHGHLDRLEALLEQEGMWNRNEDDERQIVQLGDLGHFGNYPSGGQPTGDRMCWEFAYQGGIDLVLWGNHDRACVDSRHEFGGYQGPSQDLKQLMRAMVADGRLKMAHAVHGHLLTHAGLHASFKYQKGLPKGIDVTDPYQVADYINVVSKDDRPDANHAIFDAISYTRGGGANAGGILWRDYEEKLYREFPQIFGHSASRNHVVRPDGESFCIDIGGRGDRPGDNCLAGIWLPEKRIVEVRL